MLYISAGHCNDKQSKNYDSGAVGVCNRTEADETVRLRDKVTTILRGKGAKFVQDANTESLGEYLRRIQTGTGSMVCEFHFNASDNPAATGAEVIVGVDYDKFDMACAKELAVITAKTLDIKLRGTGGVITEAESHRGKLGLMREQGTVVLVEVCFISNPQDMSKYDAKIDELAEAYAEILLKYENMLQ